MTLAAKRKHKHRPKTAPRPVPPSPRARSFGVIIFPGSNCDMDTFHALRDQMGAPVRYLWHEDRDLSGVDCVLLPGGFTYGDYLRVGAIARFSPIMQAVSAFAGQGGLVLGICNGFQILLEAGLLPGAMMRNRGQLFVCKYVHLRTEQTDTPFTRSMQIGQLLHIPVAHGEGSYYADAATLAELEDNRQIIFRYCDPAGELTEAANPNGSVANIAGLCNRQRNVLGLMPHPERCCDPLLGSADGRKVFESLLLGVGR
jgi:phosphoribosylformylglycinamidine synthase